MHDSDFTRQFCVVASYYRSVLLCKLRALILWLWYVCDPVQDDPRGGEPEEGEEKLQIVNAAPITPATVSGAQVRFTLYINVRALRGS
eukprot:COSAG05_NODE_1010_length_6207_cov_3.771447_6_plen_88_part_00